MSLMKNNTLFSEFLAFIIPLIISFSVTYFKNDIFKFNLIKNKLLNHNT